MQSFALITTIKVSYISILISFLRFLMRRNDFLQWSHIAVKQQTT